MSKKTKNDADKAANADDVKPVETDETLTADEAKADNTHLPANEDDSRDAGNPDAFSETDPEDEAGDANEDAGQDDAGEDGEEKKALGQAIMDEVRFFAGLLIFLVLFNTIAFGHYKIPSESMQPTLEVGDRLYVSKFAYGYSRHSLPFFLNRIPLPEGQIFSRQPKRGDVVVFRNPNGGLVMIKRVVGLPGDEIVVSRGRAYLNGEVIERKEVARRTYREDEGSKSILDWIFGRKKLHKRWGNKLTVTEFTEQWPDEDAPHHIYELTDMGHLDDIRPMTVPPGHIFVMGDNRDRSNDSRAVTSLGFVPQDHLIGRADRIMFSFKKCPKDEALYCPPRPFMKKL